jgi:hypothetical protein
MGGGVGRKKGGGFAYDVLEEENRNSFFLQINANEKTKEPTFRFFLLRHGTKK